MGYSEFIWNCVGVEGALPAFMHTCPISMQICGFVLEQRVALIQLRMHGFKKCSRVVHRWTCALYRVWVPRACEQVRPLRSDFSFLRGSVMLLIVST